MKKFMLTFAAGLFAAATAAQATTITFDEVALTEGLPPGFATVGTQITNQYQSYGVIFSIVNGYNYASGATYLGNNGGGFNPVNSQHVMGVNTLPFPQFPNQYPNAVLTASFVDPNTLAGTTASGVSVWVSDTDAWTNPRIFVQAFSASNALLETQNLMVDGAYLNFASSGIAKLVFTDYGSDGFVLDDLSFTAAAAPAPGAFALFGLGLLGISVLRRRLN